MLQQMVTWKAMSWCQASICGPGPEIYYCQLWVCFGGAPSLTRECVSFSLLTQIRDSPNLEDQVLAFIYPMNMVAQIPFRRHLNSQRNGGDI
jgi:hypothetical protein